VPQEEATVLAEEADRFAPTTAFSVSSRRLSARQLRALRRWRWHLE